MKNRIIVLLLSCVLSVMTQLSFSQSDSTMTTTKLETSLQGGTSQKKRGETTSKKPEQVAQIPTLKAYCLSKDTTIIHDNVTFYLHKNSWMMFSDTIMELFYDNNGNIDTIKINNIYALVKNNQKGTQCRDVDTLRLIKPNFKMEFKRFILDQEEEAYSDSLFITETTKGDTIYVYLPSAEEPLSIVGDTIICIEQFYDTIFNGIVASVGDNVPIYYTPIEIKLVYQNPKPKEPKSSVIILITVIVIVLLAVAGFLFFFFAKKKNKDISTCSIDRSENETKSTGEKKSDETEDSKTLKAQIANLENQLKDLNRQLKASKEQLENAKQQVSNLKQVHEKQMSELKKEHKENIEKKEREFADEREKLNRKIKEKETEIKNIEAEIREEMQKKIHGIEEELNKKEKTLDDTLKKLTSTEDDLDRTRIRLKTEESNMEILKEAQRQFTDKLTFTPWASDYSGKIVTLFDVADKVVKTANKLMSVDVADPYLIAKALANYEMNIGSIDMPRFSAEVFMAANKQMAFNESGIVNLATVEEKSRQRSLRRYYIDEYLKKYINAIVVLNESLAGVHRLIPDLPESATKTFGEYRAELNKCFSELEIKVISVKLFDKVTNNVDLKVTEIDYDTAISADSILEITNCIVYAADADRPSEKIYVKSQK